MEDREKEILRGMVLAKFLAGHLGPQSVANALKMPEAFGAIQTIMASVEFAVAVRAAKRDMATSVLDTIKQKLHEYREAMDTLALEAVDPRVKFQALKDLLDRGGTGAAKQISLTSPAAYKKTLEEFAEDPDGKEVADGSPPPSTGA